MGAMVRVRGSGPPKLTHRTKRNNGSYTSHQYAGACAIRQVELNHFNVAAKLVTIIIERFLSAVPRTVPSEESKQQKGQHKSPLMRWRDLEIKPPVLAQCRFGAANGRCH
ncbi:hypothetical protein EVAR_94158_1 [Eumeta japonica]|uniref:Uncharacterized protein n=1 Tax=Eumeta variegata TaxID=151549 RepID=A0A4C1U766_EUMVA|nr:hypothetical protein EVAR_94158_1 [Eumeta japonica]